MTSDAFTVNSSSCILVIPQTLENRPEFQKTSLVGPGLSKVRFETDKIDTAYSYKRYLPKQLQLKGNAPKMKNHKITDFCFL